jgi:hypothetical protein
MRPLLVVLVLLVRFGAACDPGRFFRPTNASECRPCAACEVDEQFALRPCDADHDTVCANCTECVEAQSFERLACEGARDTVCQPCAVCEAGRTFAAVECGLDTDRACAPCTRCASLELRPCDTTRDAVCGTRLALRFESERPPSAFTRAMLRQLAVAVARGLGLPEEENAFEAPEAAYRRRYTVQVELRLRVEVNASRVAAVDWAAVARASGLPIERLSCAVVPLLDSVVVVNATLATKSTVAIWPIVAWFGVAGSLLVCLTGYVCVRRCRRRRARVAHSGFTDLFAAAIIQTEAAPGFSRSRARP